MPEDYVPEHWAIDRPWRCGSQVGRTLYVDAEEKNPRNLFGLVDEAAIATHIVEIHNWWLDLVLAEKAAQRDGSISPCGHGGADPQDAEASPSELSLPTQDRAGGSTLEREAT